jgi:hypothetical protein
VTWLNGKAVQEKIEQKRSGEDVGNYLATLQANLSQAAEERTDLEMRGSSSSRWRQSIPQTKLAEKDWQIRKCLFLWRDKFQILGFRRS